MSNDSSVMLRLPSDLLDRARRLVPLISDDPTASAFGRVTRAAVLRLAIIRGLAVLEDEFVERKRQER